MNAQQPAQPARYIVDESALDVEASRQVGILLLGWAAAGADKFVLTVDDDVYADPRAARALLSPISGEEKGPDPHTHVLTGGIPPADFVENVTRRDILARSVSGDLTNVEDVALFASERRRYLAADYGRTQVLLLDDGDVAELRSRLRELGQPESALIPAPARI